ncbi:MAG TPA: hypothetical protein VG099_27045 [Gemmataceae bacterium]|nr:hypothetical protein [Gemmataceae bacterium]
MNRSDWTLLTISAAKGQPLSPVQLQKAMFLLWKNLPQVFGIESYRFVPHNYGPFDARVYSDAEMLARQGLVYIMTRSSGGWSEYGATPLGLNKANEIERHVDPQVRQYLFQIVDWVRQLSFQDLVRSIYQAYPEYRANSVFQSG